MVFVNFNIFFCTDNFYYILSSLRKSEKNISKNSLYSDIAFILSSALTLLSLPAIMLNNARITISFTSALVALLLSANSFVKKDTKLSNRGLKSSPLLAPLVCVIRYSLARFSCLYNVINFVYCFLIQLDNSKYVLLRSGKVCNAKWLSDSKKTQE